MRGQKPARREDIYAALPSCLQIPQWRTKQLCNKVVNIFAGLMKAEIWLKQSTQGSTDCERYLYAPLHDPEAYIVVCHELSHWYFGSNILARDIFVDEYSDRLINRFRRTGSPIIAQPMFHENLKGLLRFLINIFDDHRVAYLWSRVYPGDGIVLETRWGRLTREMIQSKRAEEEFFSYCLAVSSRMTDDIQAPRAEFVAVRPVLEDAFQKCATTDFQGLLVVVRQTVDRILNVLLDMLDEQDQKKQPFAGSQSQQTQKAAQMVAAALGDTQDADDKSKDQDQGGQGDGQGQQNDQAKQKPDPSENERRRATMLGLMAALSKDEKKLGQDREDELYGDSTASKFAKRNKQKLSTAHTMVNTSFDTNPHDYDDFEDVLEAGRMAMTHKIDEAKNWVQNVEVDDWLSKESKCRIKFIDVPAAELGDPVRLSPEEEAAAKAMRIEFIKILGRKRHTLEDAGDEPDVQALIDRRLDRSISEVWEAEEPGAGFYGLLLCDASGSMNNHKYTEVEKAEKMLRIAMDFPFVEIEKWLFSQGTKGQVDLFRVDPHEEGSSRGVDAWGTTPIHEAVRVGARQCLTHNKIRRLFVLTDGHPVYSDFRGNSISTKQLIRFTGHNIEDARHNQVGVYGLAIGAGVDDKMMNTMFGHPKFWRRSGGKVTTVQALVSLVRGQFMEYLRTKH